LFIGATVEYVNMKDTSISSRPILIDRLQVTVTPKYYDIFNKLSDNSVVLKPEYVDHKDLLIAHRKFKGFKKGRGGKRYLINVPSNYPFISDICLQAWNCFAISFKFNFTRYLRFLLKDKDSSFDLSYSDSIQLDDDNFITSRVWSSWNSDFVYDLFYGLNSIIVGFANEIFADFVKDSSAFISPVIYSKATVSQIETNIDFYVGCNQSMFFITRLYDLFTDFTEGNKFRHKLGAIGIKCKIPFDTSSVNDELTTFNKNSFISIGFPICKDLYFKVYRKTTEDIRIELMMNSSFLKRKFYTARTPYNLDKDSSSCYVGRIIKPVLEFSKDFFKNLDFISYLNDIGSSSSVVTEYMSRFYRVNSFSDPAMNDVMLSISNNTPISNARTIRALRTYLRHYRCWFKVERDSYTGKELFVPLPSPSSLPVSRKRLLPYSTKKAPKVPKPVLKYLFVDKDTAYQTSFADKLYVADSEPMPIPKLSRNFRSGSALRKKGVV
jgi:hypothetical protein